MEQDLSGNALDSMLNAPAQPTPAPGETASTPAVIPSDAQYLDPAAAPAPVITDPAIVQPALAPAASVAAPEPPRPPAPQTVPLPELLETRKRAQTAEQALARESAERAAERQQFMEMMQRLAPQQRQPQQPEVQPIDPNVDPAGAFLQFQQQAAKAFRDRDQYIAAELQKRDDQTAKDRLNDHLNMSQRQAETSHGKEIVAEALQAAIDSGFGATFRQQADPYGAMVQWYSAQKVAREIGTNPEAWRAQERAKIAAEERARVIAELRTGKPLPPNIPPSLATATRSNSAAEVVVPTREFFNDPNFGLPAKRG